MKFKLKFWVLLFVCTMIFWSGSIGSRSHSSLAASDSEIYLLNRFSFGSTAAEVKLAKSQGIKKYLKAQLNPKSIPESPQVERYLAKLDTLKMSPVEMVKKYRSSKTKLPDLSERERKELSRNLAKIKDQATNAHLMRAIASPRQLQEVMVDFWLNHFNIYINKTTMARLFVGLYERDAIRPYSLGKFRDILGATARNPEMLLYLDNWLNTDPKSPGAKGQFNGLNENYARELMELHTLGVDGGYTQNDVIALAKILTGWGIDLSGKKGNPNGFYFWKNRHDFSDKVFLGKKIKGKGAEEVEQALDILARHPSTAKYISYKLAQYFVADEPPASLVSRLAKSFQSTDGDIKAVLTTLIDSPELSDPRYRNSKYKTPYQYVVSAARVTEAKSPNFQKLNSALIQMGMPLYGCSTPDGYKNTQEAWLNPDSAIRRVSWAIAIGRGNFDTVKDRKIDAIQIAKNLGNNFSSKTQQAIEESQPKLRAALILGSPEMMKK
jgi:uncharacterized protein (DUF1800 family)